MEVGYRAGFCWAVLGCAWLCWAVLGWAVLGCAGWAALEMEVAGRRPPGGELLDVKNVFDEKNAFGMPLA